MTRQTSVQAQLLMMPETSLYKKGQKTIPPTSASLIQYVKRSAYQAHTKQWGQYLMPSPPACPDDWGWIKGPL